mgnify:CR=1 FL=1
MKYLRSLQSRVVFKCAVVPALLLCAIFRNPALQWFAVAASALWLSVVAIGFWAEAAPKLKRHKRTKAKPAQQLLWTPFRIRILKTVCF